MRNTIAGIILAGGQSRRMGGSDKVFCRLGGETLLARAVRKLAPQVSMLAINTNQPTTFARGAFGAGLGDAEELICLPDPIAGFVGPLGGILAGMLWAREQRADWLISVAVDTPFFPDDLALHLHKKAIFSQASLVLAATKAKQEGGGKNHRHPTFGIWACALADDLHSALRAGVRKVVAWSDTHSREIMIFKSEPYDPFFNVNTPRDLLNAKTMLTKLAQEKIK